MVPFNGIHQKVASSIDCGWAACIPVSDAFPMIAGASLGMESKEITLESKLRASALGKDELR